MEVESVAVATVATVPETDDVPLGDIATASEIVEDEKKTLTEQQLEVSEESYVDPVTSENQPKVIEPSDVEAEGEVQIVTGDAMIEATIKEIVVESGEVMVAETAKGLVIEQVAGGGEQIEVVGSKEQTITKVIANNEEVPKIAEIKEVVVQPDSPGLAPITAEGPNKPQEAKLGPSSAKPRKKTPNIPLSTAVHFGPEPSIVTCAVCQNPVVTTVEPVTGKAFIIGMVVSAVLVPVFGIGLIPGCVLLTCKPAHDIVHKCPKCLNEVGKFSRI